MTTEPHETSAGETGGREAMSDERLAEIRDVYADDHEVIGELAAEVEWLRGRLEAAWNEGDTSASRWLSYASDLEAKLGTERQRAETAERELAEMRDKARWMRLELRTRREGSCEETCHGCGHWLYVHREDVGCVACPCEAARAPKPLEAADDA